MFGILTRRWTEANERAVCTFHDPLEITLRGLTALSIVLVESIIQFATGPS